MRIETSYWLGREFLSISGEQSETPQRGIPSQCVETVSEELGRICVRFHFAPQ